MQYRNLGASGVKVSNICMGAMTFGEPDETAFMHKVATDDKTAFAIMDRAFDAGVNFIDNADIYGQDGLAEKVLGDWIKERGVRDQIVLATKYRSPTGGGPNGRGASRYRMMKCVEDSLRRHKTDRIDLYQVHMQDADVHDEEIMRGLDDLVRSGKVLYVGASNYTAYRLMESLWVCDKRNYSPFVTLQAQYNLITRELEREHIPLCQRHGLGLLTWSPLASGFLTGKFRKGEAPPPNTRIGTWEGMFGNYDNARAWKIIDALEQVSNEHNASIAQVALAWLLHQPVVTSVIIGARSMSQIDDNLKAADIALNQAQIELLNAASDFDIGYPYSFIRDQQGQW